ncbi:DUF6660 family protein [Terrimonas ferruginea]|uniref:DUF6660 family protein n=1 Tax=Terrimonas ferruginea TaxID=249 RepID=UPI0012DE5420|nr:DUF6660 family protein [Terrimonas ferruginea]
MRYFASFMAFMMLALSILPCRDNPGSEPSAAIYTLSSQHDPHQHEDHKDVCSPLCSCACCATSSVTAPAIEFTTAAVHHHPGICGFRSGSLRQMAIPVWQPPQLIS